MLVNQDGVMWILLKLMHPRRVSKRNVIAITMAFGAGSVRYLCRTFVLISVLAMDSAMVAFVVGIGSNIK